MGQDEGLMSQKEVQRLTVLRRVLDKGLEQAQAARQLGLSVRQVKRLCRRLREEGATGLVSRRRGRPSNRRIEEGQREHYMEPVRAHYADFGPLLAHEYLRAEHGFGYSVQTLRGWMMRAGLWQAKQRRPADDRQPLGDRGACQHIGQFGQFGQQGLAADELNVVGRPDDLEQAIRRAAPEQRGHGNVGVKNDPHPRRSPVRRPGAHDARPAQP